MKVRKLKTDELQHHGIKGQKWGVRRYQNYDGTLINKSGNHYTESEQTPNGTTGYIINGRKKRTTGYSKGVKKRGNGLGSGTSTDNPKASGALNTGVAHPALDPENTVTYQEAKDEWEKEDAKTQEALKDEKPTHGNIKDSEIKKMYIRHHIVNAGVYMADKIKTGIKYYEKRLKLHTYALSMSGIDALSTIGKAFLTKKK